MGMHDFRIERDAMGEVEVPAEAYYGASTVRAVANFAISGRGIPPRLIRALGLLKWAAARANGELGVLPAEVAGAVAQAAMEVAGRQLRRRLRSRRFSDWLRHLVEHER